MIECVYADAESTSENRLVKVLVLLIIILMWVLANKGLKNKKGILKS